MGPSPADLADLADLAAEAPHPLTIRVMKLPPPAPPATAKNPVTATGPGSG
ncbi:hypothetical protein Psi01_24760 [Planobispora siamensis]|uniref:Uncharacterized protein n=1 Tax=Planobispora siamensis TaxID=936338 RepID=A0A8J3WLI3_9ACTN|nr:hypothetical protein Psi01_24760 [Planobispora siamensis]